MVRDWIRLGEGIMRRIVIAAALLVEMATGLKAQADTASGNHFLPVCRVARDEKAFDSSSTAFGTGHCVGAVRSLMYVGAVLPPDSRFCIPKDTTTGQGVHVVVLFME